MAKAKTWEKAMARELRAEGRSLREIGRELGVSLASASIWTADVMVSPPITAEDLEKWTGGNGLLQSLQSDAAC